MKRLKWPRPPIILGVVLGGLVERYLNITIERYGDGWITSSGLLFGAGRDGPLAPWQEVNWIVIVMFALSAWGLFRPFKRQIQEAGGVVGMIAGFGVKPRLDLNSIMYVTFITLLTLMLWDSLDWKPLAKRVPIFVGWVTIGVVIVSFLNHTFHQGRVARDDESGEGGMRSMHLDIAVDDAGVDSRTVLRRAAAFLAWLIGFVCVTGIIGMLPTIFLFVIAYMRAEAKEPWGLTLPCAAGLAIFSYVVFDYLLALPWPRLLIGILFPGFAEFIPSLN